MPLNAYTATKKFTSIKYAISVFTLVLVGSSFTALAQGQDDDGPEDDEEASSWGLGLAAISQQKPFKDIDRETIALPVVFFENQYVEFFGPFIDFKLPGITISDTQQIDFRIPIQYDFGGYDKDEAEETPILNGMDKREGGFWAGAKVGWKNPLLDITAEWLSDISGNSDGQRFSLTMEHTWMFGHQFMLTPRVEATWQDDKYIDYHYGVRAHEVRVDRPAYVGEAGVSIEYGIRGIYMVDRRNSLFLDLGVTSLADEIKASPLVDSSTENSVLFGYRSQF
jgi:outer membrane protein